MNEIAASTPVGSQARYALAMLVSLAAISTAAIWVRMAGDASPVLLVCGRTLLAGALLLPWLIAAPPNARAIKAAVIAGCFLALHFLLWFTSLDMTTVAASTTLACTTPLWLALYEALRGGRVRKPTWIAVALGMTGTVLIGGGDLYVEGGLLGDALALASALAVAIYFEINRRARATASLLPYVAINNLAAGLVLAPTLVGLSLAGMLNAPAIAGLSIVCLALFPQMIGHNLLIWALKHRGPALVTLVVLGEPVCAAVMAYVIWREVPSTWTIAGSLLILPALALALLAAPDETVEDPQGNPRAPEDS